MPKFFPGLPFFQAIFIKLFGSNGFFLVSPAMGLIAVGTFYLYLKKQFSPLWTVTGTLLLATHPLFLTYANYPDTHITLLAFSSSMLFFWQKWEEKPTIKNAFWFTVIIGFMGLTHLTSLLLILGIFPSLITKKEIKNSIITMFAVGMIFVLILALYNKKAFGQPWITGYHLSGDGDGFSPIYFASNVKYFGFHFVLTFFPLLPLFFLNFGYPTAKRWSILLSVFPYLIVYLCYYYGRSSIAYYRFFIILFPWFLWGIIQFLVALKIPAKFKQGIAFALILFSLTLQLYQGHLWSEMVVSNPEKKMMADMSQWASQNLPENAVIFTEYPFLYQLGNLKHFEIVDLKAFNLEQAQSWLNPNEKAPYTQKIRLDLLHAFYQTQTRESLQALFQSTLQRFKSQRKPIYLLSTEVKGEELKSWKWNEKTWILSKTYE
ncbi:MAG: glycosyltransferase family 39 protein [Bacteriovoracaceae bacterium]